MSRPEGKPLLWSSDTNFTDPGKLWDGQPTKERPSVGVVAAGYYPDRRRPVVVDNFVEHDNARRLRHLDMIEAINWPEPAAQAGSVTSPSGNIGGKICRSPTRDHRLVFVNNGSGLMESYDGGYSWTDVGIAGAPVFADVAASDNAVVATYETGGAGAVVAFGLSDLTWGGQTLTGNIGVDKIVSDDKADCFFIGGTFNFAGGIPGVWRLADGGGVVPMAETVLAAGSASTAEPILFIAAGPTIKYAAALDIGAPQQTHLFSWVDGDLGLTNRTGPDDANQITGLYHLPEDGVFLLISSDGTDSFVYTKSDASALAPWTLRATLTDTEFGIDGGAVLGSVIIAPATYDGHNYLAVSGDQGATWELIADPVRRHAGAPTPECQFVRSLGDQFAATGYKAAGVVYTAYSARVRVS